MASRIRRKVLPSGTVCYQVLVRVNGKEQHFGNFGLKKHAESRLNTVLAQVAAGTLGHPVNFTEFVETWLEGCKGNVKSRTLKGYEQIVRLHLEPQLGGFALTEITPKVAQDVINAATAKGLAPLTVQKVQTILRMILRMAQAWGYIQSNPAERTHPVGSGGRRVDYLAPDEVAKLLENAGRSLPIIATAVMTGLREGELFALRRGDVDLKHRRITVRESYHPEQGFTKPKSKAAERSVPFCSELERILTEHLSGPGKHSDLVFTAPRGGPHDPYNFVRVEFRPALERAGLRRIRFHDLRHTYATLMISLGANLKALQTWMGHASIRTMFDFYGHLLNIDDEKVQDRLAAIMRPRTEQSEDEEA